MRNNFHVELNFITYNMCAALLRTYGTIFRDITWYVNVRSIPNDQHLIFLPSAKEC
jgi:hypothetical protein